MRKATFLMLLVCILLSCGIIFVSYLNCAGKIDTSKGSCFWEVSFIPAVNVLFFLWITFFVIQLTTDQRKQKDILLSLILKLQALSQSAELLSNENPSVLLMKQREMNSIVYALKKSLIKSTSRKEIEYIQKQMEEYERVSSEYLYDRVAFNDQIQELRRLLGNVCNKLNDMLINLF